MTTNSPSTGIPRRDKGPPGQQSPYNANVPPMAVAEGGQEGQPGGGKAAEYGKKFGKKMGNAGYLWCWSDYWVEYCELYFLRRERRRMVYIR